MFHTKVVVSLNALNGNIHLILNASMKGVSRVNFADPYVEKYLTEMKFYCSFFEKLWMSAIWILNKKVKEREFLLKILKFILKTSLYNIYAQVNDIIVW